MDNVKIFGDRVIVESYSDNSSLIHVVDTAKWRYKVVGVGLGRKTEFGQFMTPPVSVGDVIVVNPQNIFNVDIKGKTYKLVNSPDIIAKE